MGFTAENVRELLSYDAETGAFTWLKTASNRRKQGEIAGCLCKRSGYVLIGYRGRIYKASRLAWLYVHGEWPSGVIDHINGNRADDRISNLREATQGQNVRNRGKQKNNSSGFKGVSAHQGKWVARLTIDGKTIRASGFDTPELAANEYSKMARLYHGDFART